MIPGLKYLQEQRHLTDETIKTFHLGYIDRHGELYADPDFPKPDLSLKDSRFNGTAIFPIFSLYGEMIAISARIIEPRENSPKYVNTVYSKADHLFGLHKSWPECLRTQTVYVVEGNVDFLMMYQHGIKNSVAMLGSNLTTKQLALLTRFVRKIVLVPDGDAAGQKVLERAKGLITKVFYDADFKMDFSYISLPTTYDPDKFLREAGPAELLKREQSLFATR